MDDTLIRRLFLAGLWVEARFGRPQDIEWAWRASDDRLFLVQSRDVTAFAENPGVAEEQVRILSEVLTGDGTDTAVASVARGLGRRRWHRGTLDEVAEDPSPFARAMRPPSTAMMVLLERHSGILVFRFPNVAGASMPIFSGSSIKSARPVFTIL